MRQRDEETLDPIWGLPKSRGTYWGDRYNKDYSILGVLLGSSMHKEWQVDFVWRVGARGIEVELRTGVAIDPPREDFSADLQRVPVLRSRRPLYTVPLK